MDDYRANHSQGPGGQIDGVAGLTALLDDARARLIGAAKDRNAAMHAPVVVTGDGDARIMVLRAADADLAALRFHTDRRSPKVAVIGADPRLTILAYDPQDRVQLRLTAQAHIEHEGPVADAAWADATPLSRRVYLVTTAPGGPRPLPGSALPEDVQHRRPTPLESEAGRPHFSVILARITAIDWLRLGSGGGLRARFVRDRDGDGWQGAWIAP
eukprot:gene3567-3613_t